MFILKNISTPGRIIYPSLLWKVNTHKKELYLTFDDGPIPEVTPWVLSMLKNFQAKATFFCIGDNVRKFPQIYEQVLAEGHSTGNHTFNHLNGWKTSNEDYLNNVLLAEEEFLKYEREDIQNVKKEFEKGSNEADDLSSPEAQYYSKKFEDPDAPPFPFRNSVLPTAASLAAHSRLFRPPYGKIGPSQIKVLQQKGYKIVMWDVLSQDYDKDLSAEKCIQNVVDYAKPGSVVVFHDSVKAFKNLKTVLPQVLTHYKKRGFEFKAI